MSNYQYLADDGLALHGYCDSHAEESRKSGSKFVHHEWARYWDADDEEQEVFCRWCSRLRRDVEETRPIALYRSLVWGWNFNFNPIGELPDHKRVRDNPEDYDDYEDSDDD